MDTSAFIAFHVTPHVCHTPVAAQEHSLQVAGDEAEGEGLLEDQVPSVTEVVGGPTTEDFLFHLLGPGTELHLKLYSVFRGNVRQGFHTFPNPSAVFNTIVACDLCEELTLRHTAGGGLVHVEAVDTGGQQVKQAHSPQHCWQHF